MCILDTVIMSSTEIWETTKADSRLAVFPIARPAIYKMYLLQESVFWQPKEISMASDRADFNNKLTSVERNFVIKILAFFAVGDTVVNKNITKRFGNEVPYVEGVMVLEYQKMMENVHARMYSIQIDTLISDSIEKQQIFNAVETMPVIADIMQWMYDTIESDAPFAERLLRMACVEGIFFQGCFCAIYWLGDRGLLPGVAQANISIAKDEAMHTATAALFHTYLKPEHRLNAEKASEIVHNAVMIAEKFTADILEIDLPQMNQRLMSTYIRTTADNLLKMFEFQPLFGTKIPIEFGFLTRIDLVNVTNIFEARSQEYELAHEANGGYELTADF